MKVIGQEEFDRLIKKHEKWLDSVEWEGSWDDLEHSLDNAGEGRLVLDGVDLSGLRFDGVDLKGSKFTNSKISNSSFVDSDFYLAKFDNSIIEDTTFEGSHFTLSEFEGVEVVDSNFSGAWMQMLTIKGGSVFDNCEFKRTTLNDTRFVESYILNSDLSNTALISTSYHKQNEMFLFSDDLDGTLQRMEKDAHGYDGVSVDSQNKSNYLPDLYLKKLVDHFNYSNGEFDRYLKEGGVVELANDLGDSLDLIDSKQAKDVIERSYDELYKRVYSQPVLSESEWKGHVAEGLSEKHIDLKSKYERLGGNMYEKNNVSHIVGSGEYGETPYLVSERVGNFSLDMIVYGYDEANALDNWAEFGEGELGWEVPELPDEELEGEYYYANGYFPVDLSNIHMKEVDDRFVESVRGVSEKENDRQGGFERE